MSDFKIKFRGVRGSYPIANKDYLEYGGNTSCVEVRVNGHLIILDAGTGLIDIGNELMEEYISSGATPEQRTPINATVLLSHIHQDHIQGFTFFRPLHIPTSRIDVYGNVSYEETLSDELANLLFGKSFPLDLGDIAGNLNINDITDTDGIILRANEPPIIKRIEELSLEHKITIPRWSIKAGITPSTIYSIMGKKSGFPRITTLKLLCDAIGITLSEFFDADYIDEAFYEEPY